MKLDSNYYTLMDFYQSADRRIMPRIDQFHSFLRDWKAKGTYTYHRQIRAADGVHLTVHDPITGQDRTMVSMVSNNYLGLSQRPEICEAAREALAFYGTGLCGSRFLSGTYDLVVALEKELATFEDREEAVVFTSGYQANVGTVSALLRPGDCAYVDRLAHASIIDGCRLAGCRTRYFRHNDPGHLAKLLKKDAVGAGRRMVIVDGVFSMDGDLAPLRELAGVVRAHDALFMVDEAHATGVLGERGRGSVEAAGVEGDVDIVLGTFSKTLAATGGFIAANQKITDYVRHYGRSYMFSASMTPATAASALAALRVLQQDPQPRKRLSQNVRKLHGALKQAGFEMMPATPQSGIMTVIIGSDNRIRRFSKRIFEEGLFTGCAAYPAVSRNRGRLRLSLSALHADEDLMFAYDTICRVGRELGVIEREVKPCVCV